jgi:hypothetical protein
MFSFAFPVTCAAQASSAAARSRGGIEVKGRKQSVAVFELLGIADKEGKVLSGQIGVPEPPRANAGMRAKDGD